MDQNIITNISTEIYKIYYHLDRISIKNLQQISLLKIGRQMYWKIELNRQRNYN